MGRGWRVGLMSGLLLGLVTSAWPQGETPVRVLDGDASGEMDVLNTAPTGTEYGAVTRPILSPGNFTIGRVFLRNPGDTANMGDATTPVRTDPTGTTTQPVSGPLTDVQLRASRVPVGINDASGEAATATGQPGATARGLVVRQPGTATSALSNVAGSATSVTCLVSNTSRMAATLFNDSTADAFVKLGATASTSSFTVKLVQDAYYRPPAGYTGIIDCIWSSASGNMRVTELSP